MGVILTLRSVTQTFLRTPHTHGGDSFVMGFVKGIRGYSPYTWGKLLVNCQWLNKIVEKGRFKNAWLWRFIFAPLQTVLLTFTKQTFPSALQFPNTENIQPLLHCLPSTPLPALPAWFPAHCASQQLPDYHFLFPLQPTPDHKPPVTRLSLPNWNYSYIHFLHQLVPVHRKAYIVAA